MKILSNFVDATFRGRFFVTRRLTFSHKNIFIELFKVYAGIEIEI